MDGKEWMTWPNSRQRRCSLICYVAMSKSRRRTTKRSVSRSHFWDEMGETWREMRAVGRAREHVHSCRKSVSVGATSSCWTGLDTSYRTRRATHWQNSIAGAIFRVTWPGRGVARAGSGASTNVPLAMAAKHSSLAHDALERSRIPD